MNDYRDVRKRVLAIVLAGVLLSTTIGPALYSIAESANGCDGFVDSVTYDGGVLVAEAGGDGLCDKCGRVEMDHFTPEPEAPAEVATEPELIEEEVVPEPEEEPQDEIIEPEVDLHVHVDADEDGICDECQADLTAENPTEEPQNPDDENVDNPDSENIENPDSDETADQKTEDEKIIEEYEEQEGDENCSHDFIYVGKGDGTHIVKCKKCGKEFITNCYLNPQGWCEVCGAYTDPSTLIVDEIETTEELKICQHEYIYTYNGDGTHKKKCSLCEEDPIIEDCVLNEQGWCEFCGEYEGEEECEHEYEYVGNGDRTHTKTCIKCGDVLVEPCVYEVYESDEQGKHKAKCTICGEEIIEDCQYDEFGYCYFCGYKEDEDEIKLVHQVFKKSFANVTVTVSGMIPEGGTVEIISISNNYAEYIINNNIPEERSVLEAFDINVYDKDGNIYQPMDDGNTLSVTFSGVKGLSSKDDCEIIRIEDNNSVSEIASTIYGDNVTFDAEHFTIYTITELNGVAKEDAYDVGEGTKIAYIGTSGKDYTWVKSVGFKAQTDDDGIYVGYKISIYRDFTDTLNPEAGTCIYSSAKTGKVIESEGSEVFTKSISESDYSGDLYLGKGVNYAVVIEYSLQDYAGYGIVYEYEGKNIVNEGSGYKGIIAEGLISVTTGEESNPAGVNSVTISSATSTINGGKINYLVDSTDTLIATIDPIGLNKRTVTWTSDNPSVISIPSSTSGELSINGAGEANITASVVNGASTVSSTVKATVYSYQIDPVVAIYTGSVIKPAVKITGGTATNVKYETSNITDVTPSSKITFTIGSNSFEKTFAIVQRDITDAGFFNDAKVTINSTGEITAVTDVKNTISNIDMTWKKDFTLEVVSKQVTTSGIKYNLLATGIGNYTGTAEINNVVSSDKPEISSIFDISWVNGYAQTATYTGSPIAVDLSKVRLRYKGNNPSENKITLSETYFDIDYKNEDGEDTNINAGTVTVNFSMTDGSYQGKLSLNFEINPVAASVLSIGWKQESGSFTYDSTVEKGDDGMLYFERSTEEIKPDSYNGKNYLDIKYGATNLKLGQDYVISRYENNEVLSNDDASLQLKFQGNYMGTKSMYFKLAPNFLLDTVVYLNNNQTVRDENGEWNSICTIDYSGDVNDCKPSVVVKTAYTAVGGTEIQKDTDGDSVTVTYSNSISGSTLSENAGEKYVILTGHGKYNNKTIKVKYTVLPVNILTDPNINFENRKTAFTYNGDEKEAQFTLSFNGRDLKKDKDYTVSDVEGDNVNVTTNGFKYTITAKGNFTGEKTLTYKINPLSLATVNKTTVIDGTQEQFTARLLGLTNAGEIEYDPDGVKPDVEISLGGNILTQSGHFKEPTYQNYKVVSANGTKAKCIIEGENNLTGTVTLEYTITPIGETDFEVTYNTYKATKKSYSNGEYEYICDEYAPVYTGSNIVPNITIKDKSRNKELILDVDYSVRSRANTKNATLTGQENKNTYIIMTLKGNYTGSMKLYYNISPKAITEENASVFVNDADVLTKTPLDVKYETVVNYYNTEVDGAKPADGTYSPLSSLMVDGKTLTKGKDFVIEVPSTTNTKVSGEGKQFIIKGQGNYTGSVTKTYTIGTDISAATVKLADPRSKVVSIATDDFLEMRYMGKIRPEEQLELGGRTLAASYYDIAYSVGGVQGDITYNAGNTVSVVCTGKAAYYGDKTFSYRINPVDISNMTATHPKDNKDSKAGYYLFYKDKKDGVYSYRNALFSIENNVSIEYLYYDGTNSTTVEYLKEEDKSSTQISLSSDKDNSAGKIGPEVRNTNTNYYQVYATAKSGSNYTGKSKGFIYKVTPASISDATIAVNEAKTKLIHKNAETGDYEIYYTGQKIVFTDDDFIVTDLAGNVLELSKQYVNEIGSSKIGSTQVTFTGTGGNYINSQTFPVNVVQVDISKDENIEAYIDPLKYKNAVYTNADVDLLNSIHVYYHGKELKRGDNSTSFDYYVKEYNTGGNELPGSKNNVGSTSSNWVIIAASQNADGTKTIFDGELKVYFDIYLDLSDENLVEVTTDKAKYSVNDTPKVTVRYKSGAGYSAFPEVAASTSEANYTVSVANNAAGPATVTVKGLHDKTVNCGTGSRAVTVNFIVDLSNATAAADYIQLLKTDFAYTYGKAVILSQQPYRQYLKIKGTADDFEILCTEVTDTTIKDTVGKKKVVIKATENSNYYTGSATYYYYVKYDLNNAMSMFIYHTKEGGSPYTENSEFKYVDENKEFKVKEDFDIAANFGGSTISLTGNDLVTISYANKISNVGDYIIKVTPVENSEEIMGSNSVTLHVLGRAFDKDHIKVWYIENNSDVKSEAYYPTYTYSGSEYRPTVHVYNDENTQLKEGIDYDITWENNQNASVKENAHVVVTGINAYAKNSITKDFVIERKQITDADKNMIVVDPVTYAGNGIAVEPEFKITFNSIKLVESTDGVNGDFKVTTNKENWKIYADQTVTSLPYTVEFIGNFYGSITDSFTVNPLSIQDSSVTINSQSMEWTGNEKTLTDLCPAPLADNQIADEGLILTVTSGGRQIQLIQGKDFDVTLPAGEKIINVKTYQITIQPKNNCTGSAKPINFEVTPRSIGKNWAINGNGKNGKASEVTITVPDCEDFVDGQDNKPNGTITITDSGVNSDYASLDTTLFTVTYVNSRTSGGKGYSTDPDKVDDYGNYLPADDSPYVIIKAKAGSNYNTNEEVKVAYSVGKDINTIVTNSKNVNYEAAFTYNGVEQIPKLKIYNDSNILLKEGTDYTVEVVEDDVISAGTKQLLIKGIGKYYGTLYENVSKKTLYTYKINKRNLEKGYNYTNGYVGSDLTSQINPKDLTVMFNVDLQKIDLNLLRSIPNREAYEAYTGYYYAKYANAEINPAIEVIDKGLKTKTQVVDPENYDIEYFGADDTKKTSRGLNYAEIKFKNNYVNEPTPVFRVYYVVLETDIEKDFKIYLDNSGVFTWNNGYPADVTFEVKSGGLTLTPNEDYTYTFLNEDGYSNIAPGKGKLVVTGINKYAGTIDEDFIIRCDITETTVVTPKNGVVEIDPNNPETFEPEKDNKIAAQFFTDKEIEPEFEVILMNAYGQGENMLLTKNQDYMYSVTSDDNFKSSGKIAITGQQPYFGEAENDGNEDKSKIVYFDIEIDSSMLCIKNYEDSYTYTKEEIKPEFKLFTKTGQDLSDGDFIKEIEYYRVDEDGNIRVTDDLINVGTIRVKFDVEIEDLKTTVEDVEYVIEPRDLADCRFVYAKTAKYNGSEIKPYVEAYLVNDETKKVIDLTLGEDYTINYQPNGKKNIAPGEGAYVVVEPADNNKNFTGDRSLTFKIKIGTPCNVKLESKTNTSITATWDREIHSQGTVLDLYTENNGVRKSILTKHVQGNTYTFTGLESAKTYYVDFMSYVKIDSDGDGTAEDKYSEAVTRKVTTGLETTDISVASTIKGKVTISWKDNGTLINYRLYRSTDDKNYTKIATIPATTGSYTDSSLESGKTYYYYVIGYAIVDGTLTKFDGKSKAVSVKVK